jgi:hypothetical protein
MVLKDKYIRQLPVAWVRKCLRRGVCSYRSDTGKANVPEHWRISWRREKQNNYLSWVLDASRIILYREVQSGYIALISGPLVVIRAHAMRVSWLWVVCLEINRRRYKQANTALTVYVEIPWSVSWYVLKGNRRKVWEYYDGNEKNLG